MGKVDPLQHPNMRLEVVRKLVDGRVMVYSNDNRRLYSLKQFEARNPDGCVWVAVKLFGVFGGMTENKALKLRPEK